MKERRLIIADQAKDDLAIFMGSDPLFTYYATREGLHKITVSPQVTDVLQAYSRPGNVRELRNLVHRRNRVHNPDFLRKSGYVPSFC